MIVFKTFDSGIKYQLYDYASLRNSIEQKYILNFDVKKINFVSDKKRQFKYLIPKGAKNYRLVKGTTIDKEEILIGYTYEEI